MSNPKARPLLADGGYLTDDGEQFYQYFRVAFVDLFARTQSRGFNSLEIHKIVNAAMRDARFQAETTTVVEVSTPPVGSGT